MTIGLVMLSAALAVLGIAPSFGSVAPLGTAGSPEMVTAVATGKSGEILIRFLPPSSPGVSPIDGYTATCTPRGRIRRGYARPRSAAIDASHTAVRIKRLVNGVGYSCVVRARNAAGFGPSTAAASPARAGTPSPPRSIAVTKVTAAGTLKVLIGRAANFPTAPVTGYRGVCSAPGGTSQRFRSGAKVRAATVRGLTLNRTYRCRAQAVNKFGAGSFRLQPTCSRSHAKVNFDRPAAGIRLQSGRNAAICGTGYLPDASVAVVLHSTPITVGTITADANGMIDGTVAIPASAPGGAHTLIAQGASAIGTLTQSAAVSVSYDIIAPTMTAFAFSPASIDTSTSDQTITVTATITDDLAGNAGPGYPSSPSQARFRSPSGQIEDALLDDTHRISGTAQNGDVSYTMTLPHFAEQGTWTLQSILLVDQAGNSSTLDTAEAAALGFPTTFQQTGAGDITAPNVTAFALSPTSVDTAASSQTITVTATITDDLAGNAGPGYSSSPSQARFRSPSGQIKDALLDDTHRISGTAQNGDVSYTMTIPHFAEQGTWTLQSILLVDQAGNTRILDTAQVATLGYPTGFQQTGAGDITAPNLTAFALSPTAIDTSASDQTITVTATITDDLAGNAGPGYSSSPSQVRFRSPSGQVKDALLDDTRRVSGTAQDGDVSSAMTVPHFAEQGTWTLQYLTLVDQAGNTRFLDATQVAALGFPTTFEQTGA